ncbi:MAG: hypothetical protein JSW46_03285 [Gemmatimonadota bacterium]|nr:MAG: hypothetical protein JSW46_03285 [Gemmatimonadota bacterium]
MHIPRTPTLLVALAAAAVTGCAELDGGERFAARDSAGTEIVESRAPSGDAATTWRLNGVPLLEIGLEDGPPEYQFSRVEGALRLPDGRVAVADGGSRQIRFFDADGRLLSASGRSGDAPGEYREIIGLGYGPGDSIWVFDYGNRRFTVLTADGEVARTLTLDPTLSNVTAVGRLEDGSFVVREFWSSAGRGAAVIQLGLGRDPAAVARYTPDGARMDTIGLFLGREVYILTEDGRGVMSTPLFAHVTSAAVHADDVFIGDQERFEVGVYSTSGVLRRIIRVLNVELRVTRDDIERAIEQRLASVPEEQRVRMRAQLDAMDVPATRPAYGRLLVDSQGALWIGDYAPYPDDPVLWRVFDAAGRLVTTLQVPERFRVFDIGSDWILGVWRDDLDVERVHLYHLRKDG